MTHLDIVIRDSHQQFYTMSYELTEHCKERLAQRAIDHRILTLALLYGTEVSRQGLNFYYVLSRDVPPALSSELKHKLSKLVVVCDEQKATIVTVYHGYKGLIHIRKKSKNLHKWAA